MSTIGVHGRNKSSKCEGLHNDAVGFGVWHWACVGIYSYVIDEFPDEMWRCFQVQQQQSIHASNAEVHPRPVKELLLRVHLQLQGAEREGAADEPVPQSLLHGVRLSRRGRHLLHRWNCAEEVLRGRLHQPLVEQPHLRQPLLERQGCRHRCGRCQCRHLRILYLVQCLHRLPLLLQILQKTRLCPRHDRRCCLLALSFVLDPLQLHQ